MGEVVSPPPMRGGGLHKVRDGFFDSGLQARLTPSDDGGCSRVEYFFCVVAVRNC